MSTPRFMRRLVRRFQLRVHVSMIFGRFRDSGSLEKQKNLKMMIVFWNHFKKKQLHLGVNHLKKTHMWMCFIDG